MGRMGRMGGGGGWAGECGGGPEGADEAEGVDARHVVARERGEADGDDGHVDPVPRVADEGEEEVGREVYEELSREGRAEDELEDGEGGARGRGGGGVELHLDDVDEEAGEDEEGDGGLEGVVVVERADAALEAGEEAGAAAARGAGARGAEEGDPLVAAGVGGCAEVDRAAAVVPAVECVDLDDVQGVHLAILEEGVEGDAASVATGDGGYGCCSQGVVVIVVWLCNRTVAVVGLADLGYLNQGDHVAQNFLIWAREIEVVIGKDNAHWLPFMFGREPEHNLLL